MKPITLAAILLTSLSLTGGAAFAKGGEDNHERQKQREAEFEKARKANAENSGGSLFDLLFGSDQQEAKPKSNGQKAGKQTN